MRVLNAYGAAAVITFVVSAASAAADPVAVGGNDRFDVQIDSAFYTTRYLTPQTTEVAQKGSKLLVIRYTVKNNASYPLAYHPGSVSLSVPNGPKTRYSAGMSAMWLGSTRRELRSGEVVSETSTIEIPSNLDTDVILARVGGGQETKVDLKGRLKTLSGSYSSDSGTMDEKTVAANERVEFGACDLKILQVENLGEQYGPFLSTEGGDRFVGVHVELRNASSSPVVVSAGSFFPEFPNLSTNDYRWTGYFVPDGSDQNSSVTLKPGKTARGRLVIRLHQGAKPDTLRLTDPIFSHRSVVMKL